ncbi:hypothetical protein THAOC_04787 [Thalassiosira oceanica]|uniref:Uncharacterized protein n=1 Tax=Thalassiosira oceanica TaxID=159749 RepID=K0T927_THAOC|nr:hypothetical protein THAOC_04787 [Thalassiosira oceanica]|eukprot:EJK73579.1 hypothetical protein THAOC_04787 [Thalassiosira oceanica]
MTAQIKLDARINRSPPYGRHARQINQDHARSYSLCRLKLLTPFRAMFDPYPGCGPQEVLTGLNCLGRIFVRQTWPRSAPARRPVPSGSLHRLDLAAANVLGDCLRGNAYQRRLPPDCEATRYPSPLFQAGDRVWAAEALGEAPVSGNEREAGPPADRAAPRPRSLRLPTPCSEAVKILKMDEDEAPSHPLSDCGEGDTSASCAVRTASRRPHGDMVVLGMTHRTAGETPPPTPGLVAQSGAGQGARTAARDAVLLAVQQAAEASAARGRAPGGALPGDVPGRATSAMTVTRAHPRANARD